MGEGKTGKGRGKIKTGRVGGVPEGGGNWGGGEKDKTGVKEGHVRLMGNAGLPIKVLWK